MLRVVLTASLLLSVVAVSSLHAPVEGRLSGPPLMTPNAGSVSGFRLSEDGTRVVFRVDTRSENEHEIWSAPTDGSTEPVRLSPRLHDGFAWHTLVLARGHAVFSMIGEGGGLFSRVIDGSEAPLKLHSSESNFQVSPDGSKLALYGATKVTVLSTDGSDEPFEIELSLRPLTAAVFTPDSRHLIVSHQPDTFGGESDVWNYPLDFSGEFSVGTDLEGGLQDRFTSDGRYVLMGRRLGDAYTTRDVLYSQRIDGGGFPQHTLSSDVRESELFSDNLRVLVNDDNQLRVAFLNGTAPIVLATTSTEINKLALSPDNTLAFFCTVASVFRVPTNGGSAPTVIAGPWSNIRSLKVSPDGQHLLILDDPTLSPHDSNLWVVPSTGTPVLLASGIPDAGSPGYASISGEVLPDGTVLYVSGGTLYSRPIDASTAATALESLPGNAGSFIVRQGMVAFSNEEPATTRRLWCVPVDGSSAPILMSDRLAPGAPVLSDVTHFESTPRGGTALYRADERIDEQFELYAVRTTKSFPRRRLNPDLAPDADVAPAFALSSDETHAAFWTGSLSGGYTLWSARTDDNTPPVALSSGHVFLDPPKPRLSADGSRVFFIPDTLGLVNAPSDGSSAPTVLGPDLLVEWFELDGAGQVVFASNVGGGQLFSAPIDASAPPTPIVAGGPGFEILGAQLHGGYAWFRADTTDDVFELVRVPITGGMAETMSAPMPVGGDVTGFAIAQSGRVVYRADGVADQRFELFRVLAPGNALVLTPMPASAHVRPGWVLSADGTRAFFQADPRMPRLVDILSVPTDGSSAPTTLVQVNGSTRNLSGLLPDPSGSVLAYQEGTDRYDLSYVPVAGGASVLVGTSVAQHAFSSDGHRLVYRTDPEDLPPDSVIALSLASGERELLAEGHWSDSYPGEKGELRSFLLARAGRVFVDGAAMMFGVQELFLCAIGASTFASDAPGDGGSIVR